MSTFLKLGRWNHISDGNTALHTFQSYNLILKGRQCPVFRTSQSWKDREKLRKSTIHCEFLSIESWQTFYCLCWNYTPSSPRNPFTPLRSEKALIWIPKLLTVVLLKFPSKNWEFNSWTFVDKSARAVFSASILGNVNKFRALLGSLFLAELVVGWLLGSGFLSSDFLACLI